MPNPVRLLAVALLVLSAAGSSLAQSSAPFVFTDPDPAFGTAVAAVGDTDGDGVPDVAIGTPNGGATGGGFVRVYSGRDGRLLLTTNGLLPGDRYGTSITGLGDLDGDQRGDFAVGAPRGCQLYPPGTALQYELCTSGYVILHSGATGATIGSIPANPYAGSMSLTPTLFGSTLADAGDIDQDGAHDLLVTRRGGGGFFPGGSCSFTAVGLVAGVAEIYSARTGALLRQHPGLPGDHWPTVVASIGDVDGDNASDYALAGVGRTAFQQTCFFQTVVVPYAGSRIQIHSGATGALLRTHLSDPLQFVTVAAAGDVNGDGLGDLLGRGVHPSTGAYGCFSAVLAGPAGGFVHSYTEAMPNSEVSAASVGDRDGDGRSEFLLGDPVFGRARIFSGAAGAVLETLVGPAGFGRSVADLGDLDQDGRHEFAVAGDGEVRVYWGRPLPAAVATPVGIGCGPGGTPPTLSLSGPPILGTTLSVDYGNGSPFAAAALFAGLPVAIPVPLGGGCQAFLDPGAPLLVDAFPLDASGGHTSTLALPNLPPAAGLPIVIQALATTSPTLPPGFEVTNAWHLVFGY